VTNSSSPDYNSDALDILEEQAVFVQELAASPELQATLANFQTKIGDFAYGVSLEPLPASLKGRLFERLDRVATKPENLLELMDWSIADLQKVALDLPNWQPFPLPVGTQQVIWQIDEVNDQVAFFLRIPGAGVLPHHWHATGESILVLEGNFVDDDGQVYEVGDRSIAAANTSHQPKTTMGCLILAVTSIHDKILEPA
jgi:ChrR Cupin-like domain